MPAYGIIAAKNGIKANFLDRILTDIEQLMQDKLTNASFEVTGKDKVVLSAMLGRHPVIIKLPLNSAGTKSELNNAAMLTELQKESTHIRDLIPEPLLQGTVQK